MACTFYTLLTCAIDKQKTAKENNPYHVAQANCLDRLMQFLAEKGQSSLQTHVVFEARGKREDADLELEFRQICDGANRSMSRLSLDIVIANKHANAAGLQIADLVARPVARRCMDRIQSNRAWVIIAGKLYQQEGKTDGHGLIQSP
jgi:hypothetical protein